MTDFHNSESTLFVHRPISAAAILLTVITLGFASAVKAQVAQPANVPEQLSTQDTEALSKKRSLLIDQGNALHQEIALHNQKCSSVPEDSPLVGDCRSNQASLVAEIQKYNSAVNDFNALVRHALAEREAKVKSCEAVAHQVRLDREAIERQIQTNELSQKELDDWNKLNLKAQNDAIFAGVRFVLEEFVADLEPLRSSVSKLERHAGDLAQKATRSKKYATRLSYVSHLNAALDNLEPLQGSLADKIVVKTGLDAEKTWNVARDTMRHEFRVARNQDHAIREILQDSGFREAFTGEGIDTPGLDVLAALTEQAGEEAGKFMIGLEKYERFTGPTLRAATFVRDASYSALLSYFSTQRVRQQSDLAGALAKSAGILQQRYKKSIDALRDCRQAGFSK